MPTTNINPAHEVIYDIDPAAKNEDAPRSCSCHPDDRPAVCQKRHALSACKAELTLTIPATVLEWCAANPEAAKGLAEGRVTEAMCRAGIEASPMWLVDTNVGTGEKRVVLPSRARVSLDTAEVEHIFLAMLAASTSAPSGEAQTIGQMIGMCSDCPPLSYPTNATRCLACPRR